METQPIEKEQIADNNATEKLSKVPEQLRAHVIKKGEIRNPTGRPKGSKNLTTIVLEALRKKKYKVKIDGKVIEMDGETAFAEAILENAINKKDRESLRMIWEFSDGKPKQEVDHSYTKGYEVNPEQELLYQQQFDAVIDVEAVEIPQEVPATTEICTTPPPNTNA